MPFLPGGAGASLATYVDGTLSFISYSIGQICIPTSKQRRSHRGTNDPNSHALRLFGILGLLREKEEKRKGKDYGKEEQKICLAENLVFK